MRTIIFRCALGALLLFAVWASGSRRLSLLLDRWATIEVSTAPVQELGRVVDGIFISGTVFSDSDTKNERPVSFLTDGSNRLLLVYRGLSYPLGARVAPPDSATSALRIDSGDAILLAERRSLIAWPTFSEFNANARAPDYRRHVYYTLTARKNSGASLVMKWRYEQQYYPDTGWTKPRMDHNLTTGLLSVEIKEGNAEEIAAQYIAGTKGWKLHQYRLETRESKNPEVDEIAVIFLDDEAGRSPGAGKSLVLWIDRNSRKVIKEIGAQ